MLSISQTIIYTNTKRKAEWLHEQLKKNNFVVSLIHGGMEKLDRTNVMKNFRTGSSRILVTTDLLCRGIDIQQVSIVINYDLPGNRESYLHRIGRSGRFGRKGVAINFITYSDRKQLEYLQHYYKTTIETMPNDFNSFLQ